MMNNDDNNNISSRIIKTAHSTIKETVRFNGVVVHTYAGKPVEIWEVPPANESDDEEEDVDDEVSVYSCCNAHCLSFGEETAYCGRCGEDCGGYYLGHKLTVKEIEEHIIGMQEEDRLKAEEIAAEEADLSEDEYSLEQENGEVCVGCVIDDEDSLHKSA
jgi:hypothetical protein